MFGKLINLYDFLIDRLRGMGEIVPRLVMRLIMGWEFFEAGWEKLHGENWFSGIQADFPVPFNIIPASFSWTIATWFELIGAIMLWLGLFTRFFAFSLLVLTFVATAAVHWPDGWNMWSELLKGYSVSDRGFGNYKLPALFTVMLIPLVFNGAGKLSLDYVLRRWLGRPEPTGVLDMFAVGLGLIVIGIPFLFLMPLFGIIVVLAGAAVAAFGARSSGALSVLSK